MFFEYKRIAVDNCYLFYTKIFKGCNKIIKIEINRIGINYCYNENDKNSFVAFSFFEEDMLYSPIIDPPINFIDPIDSPEKFQKLDLVKK